MKNKLRLKEYLDEKADFYNQKSFLEEDPIQIPHLFTNKQDQETAAFFAASFSWGNRKTIINKSLELMKMMENSPYDFVMNHTDKDLKRLVNFKHRTFNADDLFFFVQSLKLLYAKKESLEFYFIPKEEENTMVNAIERFRKAFLNLEHLPRSEKHLASPASGSTAKRLNMFLRWMCRESKNQEVDLGIWKNIPLSKLSCPLDVHSGNVARKLGLLVRKQNDQKSVAELDVNLRKLDPIDPVKYDFALFGLGVYGELP